MLVDVLVCGVAKGVRSKIMTDQHADFSTNIFIGTFMFSAYRIYVFYIQMLFAEVCKWMPFAEEVFSPERSVCLKWCEMLN